MNTQPTHTAGPGGVALARAAGAAGVPLLIWSGSFDPTVSGATAPGGTVGLNVDSGKAWIRSQSFGPSTDYWIDLDVVWTVAQNLGPIQGNLVAFSNHVREFVAGVAATGLISFPDQASLADNQFLAVGGVTYDVQKTDGFVPVAGRVPIDCRAATTAQSVALLFSAAISAQSGSTVSAGDSTDGTLTLGAKVAGGAGDLPIVTTLEATYAGMSGGANPILDLSPFVRGLVACDDFRSYFTRQGAQLAGFSPREFSTYFAPFNLPALASGQGIADAPIVSGNGVAAIVNTQGGGVAEIYADVADSYCAISPGVGVSVNTPVTHFQSRRWYIAARMYLSPMNPTSWAGVFLQNSTGQKLILGVHSWSSLNHFVLRDDHGGQSVALAPVDANWHDFEAWGDATGKVFARVDQGPVMQMDLGAADFGSVVTIGAGAYTGASQRMFAHLDDLLFLMPRADQTPT